MNMFESLMASIIAIGSMFAILCLSLYLLCGTDGDLFENECETSEWE